MTDQEEEYKKFIDNVTAEDWMNKLREIFLSEPIHKIYKTETITEEESRDLPNLLEDE